jgi:hypothetical protein
MTPSQSLPSRFFASGFTAVLVGLIVACPVAGNAEKPVPVTLNGQGEKLLARYAGMLESLRAEVVRALPAIDEAKKAAFLAARERFSTLAAPGQDANADAQRAHEKAEKAAEEDMLAAARAILPDVDGFLTSDSLDGPLMRIAVLTHGTPRGLAEFAQQGPEEEAIIEKLLADEPLMRQILEAGGANGGEYGEAMQVYAAILAASERAREPGGILQRLALGTAIHQPWLPGKEKGGVHGILHRADSEHDQVARYLHYELAFLDGELDPAFKDMTTWECRFITDSPYSNDDLAWTREMMRNYRPDLITMPDYKWRYVRFIKSDVPYCSTTHDPTLGSRAQEEIALGGVCGRRAFLGRLTTRAFGIPSRASTQSGHGAMSHWTPDGWVICLGAGWGVAWCGPQGGLDFLLDSQAREFPDDYRKVLRAQWLGDTFGEKDVSIQHGRFGQGGGFWDGLAFCLKQLVVKAAEVKALELMGGMKLGESDELLGDETAAEIVIPESYREIRIADDGSITVPAVAYASPRKPSDRVVPMKSSGEGYQLHYARLGTRPELVKYQVEVPAAGRYALTAEVVTVAPNQQMLVRIDREEPVPFDLPFTKGAWMETTPLEVTLPQGKTTISVTARAGNRGVSVRGWRLEPVK